MTVPPVRLLTGSEVQLGPDANGISGTYAAALFVALALAPGETLSREYLATLLWPDADPASGRQRLRMSLLKLRSQLSPQLAGSLAATKDAIRLQLTDEDIDLHLFERLARSGEPPDRLRAIELYKGNLLERFPEVSETFDEFLRSRRATSRDAFLATSLQALTDAARNEDAARFETVFQRALSIEPTNTDIVREALVFFGANGSARRVLEIYDRYEIALGRDLDVLPEASIRDLRDRMRAKAIAVSEQSSEAETPLPKTEPAGPGAPVGIARRQAGPWTGYAASMAVTAIVVLLTVGFYLGWFSRNDGPVFMLQPLASDTTGCRDSATVRSFERASQDALLAVPGAAVLLTLPQGQDAGRYESLLLVGRSVTCEGETARGSITVARAESGEVLMVRRYDLQTNINGALTARIGADVQEALLR